MGAGECSFVSSEPGATPEYVPRTGVVDSFIVDPGGLSRRLRDRRGALTQATSWTVGTSGDTDTSFNQNYSFENDLSVTSSIGEEKVAGSSINVNLDVNGSYGLSHLNNESTQLGSSSGLSVVKPYFNNSYQYSVSPFIFGTTVTDAVVDNQPLNDPNSPNKPVQTFGLLRGVFTADPSSDDWWQEAYNQAPDVALNHPNRWNIQVQSYSDSIPSNCQASNGSLDCAVLNPNTPENPWIDHFHQMRGLFITSANFPGQGPQLISAKAGDKLALTARVYNYSFMPMPAGTQVHVRFYFTPWKGTAATGQSVEILPSNQAPGTTDVILDPIPPFCGSAASNCANVPNWVYATTTFDTGAYDYTKNGNVDVVFWVVVWMENGGALVPEMPGHGLTSIPGTLNYLADAAKLEPVQTDHNSYGNNVGFFPQVFAIDVPDSGGLTSAPRSNLTVNLSKIDVSEHIVASGGHVDLSGTLSANDGTASAVKVGFYDGDPAKDGRLIGLDLIPRVRQGDPYPIAKRFMPTTCGVHQLFAVVNKGKATEVVRRAEPVRVACEASGFPGQRHADAPAPAGGVGNIVYGDSSPRPLPGR